MAKRGVGDDIFAQTESAPEDVEIPAEGRTYSTGVGLKESELEILDRIAENNDVARNAVMRYFLRDAMRRHLAGELPLPVQEETKKSLDMP